MTAAHDDAPRGDPAFQAQLLAVAERAARAAGAELMSHWRGPLRVRAKTTATDPVSEADLAAEHAIRSVLARERPDDAILGEEGGESEGNGELRWIVDPLDGTVNYLYGLPAFVVSVACEDRDGGLVGVVFDPVRHQLFTVTRSGSSRCGDELLSGSGVTQLDQALIGTGFAYDAEVREAQGQVVAKLITHVRDIRRMGAAALDLSWCAAGHLDAYFERGVHAWDVAAGTLLCERVGLVVRPLKAVPARGGSVALPSGVVVAPPALIDELHAFVA